MEIIDKTEKELGEIVPEELLGKFGDALIEGLLQEIINREEIFNNLLRDVMSSGIGEKARAILEKDIQENRKDLEEIKNLLKEILREKKEKGYTPIGDFFETVGKMSEYAIQLRSYLWEVFTDLMNWMTTYREIVEKIFLAHSLYINSLQAKSRRLKRLYKFATLSIIGYRRRLPKEFKRIKRIESIRDLLKKLLMIQKKLTYEKEFLPDVLEGIKKEVKEFLEERGEITERIREFDKIVNKEDYKRFKRIRGLLSKISRKYSELRKKLIEREIEEREHNEYQRYKNEVEEVTRKLQESIGKIKKFFKYLIELGKETESIKKVIFFEAKEIKKVLKDRKLKWIIGGRIFKKFLRFSKIKRLVFEKNEENFLKMYKQYNALIIKIFIKGNGILKRTIYSLIRTSRKMRVLESVDATLREMVGKDILATGELSRVGGFGRYLSLIKKRLYFELKDIKTEIATIKERLRDAVEMRRYVMDLLNEIERDIREALEEEKEYKEVSEEEIEIIKEIKKSLRKILEKGSELFDEIERELDELERNLLVKLKREVEKTGEEAPEEVERRVKEVLERFSGRIEEILSTIRETFEKIREIGEKVEKRDLSKEFKDVLKRLEKDVKKELKGTLKDLAGGFLSSLERSLKNEINAEINKRKPDLKRKIKELRRIKREIWTKKQKMRAWRFLEKLTRKISRGKRGDYFSKKAYEAFRDYLNKFLENKREIERLKREIGEIRYEISRLRRALSEGRKVLRSIKKKITKNLFNILIGDIKELVNLKGGKKYFETTLKNIEKKIEPVLLDIFDEDSINEAEDLINSNNEVGGLAVLLNDISEDSLELLKRLERLEEIKDPYEYIKGIVEKMDAVLDFARLRFENGKIIPEILERRMEDIRDYIYKSSIQEVSRSLRRIRDEDIQSILLRHFGNIEERLTNIFNSVFKLFRDTTAKICEVISKLTHTTYQMLITLKELRETIEELEKGHKIYKLAKVSEKKIEEKLGKFYKIRRKFRKKIKRFRKRLSALRRKTIEIVKLPGLR